jgi:EpsI family protein
MNRFRDAKVHIVVTVLVLAATLAASEVTADRKAEPLRQPLQSISENVGGFNGVPNPPLPPSVIRELKATDYLSGTYRVGDKDADLFIAFYARQRAGESMHSPKHCLPGSGWEIWDYGKASVSAGNQPVTVNKYSISNGGNRRVVLYWYQSRERVFASEYMGKLLLSRDALLHNTTAAAIVRIVVEDKPEAVQAGTIFAGSVMAQLHRMF